MSLELQLGDVGLFVLDVKITRGPGNGGSAYADIVGDLAESMPVFHVVGHGGCVRTVGSAVRVDFAVDRWLESEHKGFDGPLELNKMDAVRALVQVLGLTTVNTHQGECYTVNKDVMDFWEHKHVVNVQIEGGDLWSQKSW